MTKTISVTLALIGLQGALGGCRASAPDVIVIIADDVARSDVEQTATPHIDALASRGVRFSRAYANPVCTASRRTLLFGQWWGGGSGPSCRDDFSHLAPSPEQLSLPRIMKNAGYATALFGKWHVGNNAEGPWTRTPQLHGFDSWRAGMPSNVVRCGGSHYWKWLRVDDGETEISRQYNTIAIRDAFFAWWKTTPGSKFAYVSFQAPHLPLHVPPTSLLAGAPVPDRPTPRQLYELMLISLDTAVGEILAEVDLRNTYVFFLGDNGTPAEATRADQDPRKVKTTTFEDGVNVPMLIAGPGIPEAKDRHDLVHVVDLMATIAELVGAGIPPDSQLDSVAFRPRADEPAPTARPFVFSDYIPERIGLHTPSPGIDRDEAIVTHRYKLRTMNGKEALFDLEADPREVDPLDPADSRLGDVLAELRRHRAEVGN